VPRPDAIIGFLGVALRKLELDQSGRELRLQIRLQTKIRDYGKFLLQVPGQLARTRLYTIRPNKIVEIDRRFKSNDARVIALAQVLEFACSLEIICPVCRQKPLRI